MIRSFKNLTFSGKIVVIMLVYLGLFTQEMAILYFLSGSEPSTLIACTFAAFGVEGGATALIKVIKVKREVKNKNADVETEAVQQEVLD